MGPFIIAAILIVLFIAIIGFVTCEIIFEKGL